MSYPDTQLSAYASILEHLPESRRHVYNIIASFGSHGVSTLDVSHTLSWPINCVSGRITELAKEGLIRDSGQRGVNPSGKRCILWTVEGPRFDEKGQGTFL